MRKKRVLKLLAFGFLATAGVVAAARDDIYNPFRVKEASKVAADLNAQGAQETFSSVIVRNASGRAIAAIAPDSVGDGLFGIANRNESDRVIVDITAQDAGRVYVLNNLNLPSFVMDGQLGIGAASGDVAEMFPATQSIEPGSVVVIDALNHGAMRPSSSPYDRRVAGVVAGANEYRSAITLRAMDGAADKVPVTLTGTAYCLATNANGAIKAGDLLTTSAVPGHAMKVTDYEAARGAILGKALEDLKGDKGHVLILASLQ